MIPGIVLRLGDTDYTVPPLSLGSLESLQDRLATFNAGEVTPASVAVVIDATLMALQRNYPDMTRPQVSELLDLGNMLAIMQAVMDVSGIHRASANAGKAMAVESTGANSTAT